MKAIDLTSWEHGVLLSELNHGVKYVLLAMSCVIRSRTDDIHTGLRVGLLASYTSLTPETVRAHLRTAVLEGWVVDMQPSRRGRDWRKTVYLPRRDGDPLPGCTKKPSSKLHVNHLETI